MRNWLARQRAPAVASVTIRDVNGLKPYENYLRVLLAAGNKDKALIQRLSIDHQVACERQPMRIWITIELSAPGQEHCV